MRNTYYNDINNAIKTMHWRYGVGDIKQILRFADGRVEVIAQGFQMKPHKRRGRIVKSKTGQTIKLYGRQMTVIEIGGPA